MLGAIGQALGGIRSGFDRLDKAAERVANDGVEGDPGKDLVDTMRARQDVEANTAVVRVADRMIGSLLDVYA